MKRQIALQLYRLVYEQALSPLMFAALTPAQAHQTALAVCAWWDRHPAMLTLVRQSLFSGQPVSVGGVSLPFPLMLAAGFVKGHGFESSADALQAVRQDVNIIPGWRSIPALLGPVEFGSFTPHPRPGNQGVTLWRTPSLQGLQNRIGLKNPGVAAAMSFLCRHREALPPVWGINLAPTPGLEDLAQERDELREALRQINQAGLQPSWLTINLSCPNTEDDPSLRQTEDKARQILGAAVDDAPFPVWVKLGPDLSADQYRRLMQIAADTGTRAIVATNTLGQPVVGDPSLRAGVSGRPLHHHALAAATVLQDVRQQRGFPVNVVACGGVLDGATLKSYHRLGIQAVQYWSALIYRGPLAAPLICEEARGIT